MKKHFKVIFIAVIAVLTFLFILLSVKLYDVFGPPDNQIAVEISGRIGTKPNWDAIIQYLQNTPKGSSKAQVHEGLGKIGLYDIFTFETPEWDPYVNQLVYKEQIFFRETKTPKPLQH